MEKQLDLPKLVGDAATSWKDALTGEGSLSIRLLTSQLHTVCIVIEQPNAKAIDIRPCFLLHWVGQVLSIGELHGR